MPKLLVVLVGGVAVGLLLIALGNRNRFRYRAGALGEDDYRALANRPGWKADTCAAAQGVVLRGLVRPPRSLASEWLFFLPGNGPDLLGGSQALLEGIAGEGDLGLAVWSYRGFDGSGGVPGMQAFAADSEACLLRLVATHGADPDRIHLLSFSLGTALALRLAGLMTAGGKPPRSLVLLSPYDRLQVTRDAWWAPWSFADEYDALAAARGSSAAVLLVHGAADDAVPPAAAQALASALGPRAELLTLPGRGHADWLGDAATQARVRAFLAAHGPR